MNSEPRLPSARTDLTPSGLYLLHQMGLAEPKSHLILQGCSSKTQCLGLQGLIEGMKLRVHLKPSYFLLCGGREEAMWMVCVCLVVGVDSVVGRVPSQACQPLKYTSGSWGSGCGRARRHSKYPATVLRTQQTSPPRHQQAPTSL